jgi:putative ABC transport system permease protein
MARRDALRSRGRSILVLVMIALPVMGVTAADVVMQTVEISGAEALERRLGQADAAVTFNRGAGQVLQGFDPDYQSTWDGRRRRGPAPDAEDISRVLGRDVRAVEWRRGTRLVTTRKGVVDAESTMLDLRDPLARGIFTLERGALPESDGEVVINNALAERGFAVGDPIEVAPAP